MEPIVDPEHRVLQVVRAAELLLGDDRFGGAWIDRTAPTRPVIGIAVVDPSQPDVDSIHAAAKDAGWPVDIIAVRYSRAQLVGIPEALNETLRPRGAWVGLGWDPRFNSIRVDLRRWDEEAVSWARDRFPKDALLVVVHPGAGEAWTALPPAKR